jgi:hypothetical protein
MLNLLLHVSHDARRNFQKIVRWQLIYTWHLLNPTCTAKSIGRFYTLDHRIFEQDGQLSLARKCRWECSSAIFPASAQYPPLHKLNIVLNVQQNSLVGTIPTNLVSMTGLQYLQVQVCISGRLVTAMILLMAARPVDRVLTCLHYVPYVPYSLYSLITYWIRIIY